MAVQPGWKMALFSLWRMVLPGITILPAIVKRKHLSLLCLVNFIAHYHFTHQPGNAWHNLGTVLPDLARNFLPKARIQPDKVQPLLQLHEHLHLNEGARQHISLDKIFHNSHFFHQGYEEVKKNIRKVGFDASFTRFFFLNHIFLELMLDRYLINQHPGSADDFYASLQEINEKEITSYLALNEVEFSELFYERFHRFREIRYLYHYRDNEKLIYSLNRILMRVGLSSLSEHNQKSLVPCIEETELWIAQAFPALHQEITTKLNDT